MSDLLGLDLLAEEVTKKLDCLITVHKKENEKYVVQKHYSNIKSVICYGSFIEVLNYLNWLLTNNNKEW